MLDENSIIDSNTFRRIIQILNWRKKDIIASVLKKSSNNFPQELTSIFNQIEEILKDLKDDLSNVGELKDRVHSIISTYV